MSGAADHADTQGAVVGTGTYTYAGVKHAEILALEAAGAKARGGTLYINLEPHAHRGRTPPCTDALIAAGIGRVVASMPDPNPKVSGRGFEDLRAAGVQVEVGLLREEAHRLNEAFARYIRHGTPFVTLKAAMTLDGKIAPPPAEVLNRHEGVPAGGWVTSEVARAHVQELRHQSDALLVGAGTILSDNPLLTDRSGRPRRRPLLRVILDSRLRLPLESRLVQSVASERKNDVLVFCCPRRRTLRRTRSQARLRTARRPRRRDSRDRSRRPPRPARHSPPPRRTGNHFCNDRRGSNRELDRTRHQRGRQGFPLLRSEDSRRHRLNPVRSRSRIFAYEPRRPGQAHPPAPRPGRRLRPSKGTCAMRMAT